MTDAELRFNWQQLWCDGPIVSVANVYYLLNLDIKEQKKRALAFESRGISKMLFDPEHIE